ncbi:AMP-binding protein [Frankia sp. CNm7]|uniref:AMP-binding protein n=1 Tax=Frankia nepalensis TaxID=1836974 RepID=A0A937RLU4_9ACTN|nr:AMP-binding protein [Frankia nepalensis]MBL7502224.1 AMP-binding protein [Frankia nepalensis]MBL7513044.1 AMP-binding protein [Frankia nepalensis]MBL7523811.1 AMP-binding protein [Frankia nepalensis]MBL7628271.1 AMP-binding protein [Frankia nepalensis]
MIYRSPAADVEIPDVTLTEHLFAGARARGAKPALVDATSGEVLTYAELADGVAAVAAALTELGVGPGGVVALVSHNQPRFALALHGAIAAGAAVTPAGALLTAGELTGQLVASRATVVVASEAAAAKVAEAADAAGLEPSLRFVLGEAPGFRPFAELVARGAAAAGAGVPRPDVDPRAAVSMLPYSSGTTGAAKGVMLTHRNQVANVEQNAVGWPLGEDDVLPATLPFTHCYAFTLVLNAGLRAGATIVTLAPYTFDGFLRMAADHRITRAFFAPPMVLAIATAPPGAVERHDLSALRVGICGAAPLDLDVVRRAEARLGCSIRQGFGLTEAGPGTHQTPDAEFATTPAGSVGRLLANTQARVVDPETLQDVPAGERGELWVRGPQIMAGYLGDPAATAAVLLDDGWLRTGDLVRVDESGCFWVVDRLKEMIKYKGYQVAPAELEALLLTHPQVRDAAVVGVPDPEGGEAPKAFVVPEDAAAAPTADAVAAWVRERVAPYKKIRAVEFTDEIPRSPSGKILRRLLR